MVFTDKNGNKVKINAPLKIEVDGKTFIIEKGENHQQLIIKSNDGDLTVYKTHQQIVIKIQ